MNEEQRRISKLEERNRQLENENQNLKEDGIAGAVNRAIKNERWEWVPGAIICITVMQIIGGIWEMLPWWFVLVIIYCVYRAFLKDK